MVFISYRNNEPFYYSLESAEKTQITVLVLCAAGVPIIGGCFSANERILNDLEK